MNKKIVSSAVALGLALVSCQAFGSTFDFNLSGSGISGNIDLTYGTAMDSKTPSGYAVTGISGTFTDSNIVGVTNVGITGLVGINHATPDPTNLLAPNDFSKFPVATGLPPESNGVVTYDNLFYPGGSPQTASDYPFHGGFLDIYGLMFDLSNGDAVDVFSNGILPGSTLPDYGVAVVTSASPLDYVSGGVTATTPEPGTLWLVGTGFAGALLRRRARL